MEALKGSEKIQRRVEENRVPEPVLWFDSEMSPTGLVQIPGLQLAVFAFWEGSRNFARWGLY